MSFPVPHRIRPARAHDVGELFTLQLAAYVAEAQRLGSPHLPQLRETLADVQAAIEPPDRSILVAVTTEAGDWGQRGRLIGALRLRQDATALHLNRLVVAPDLIARGIGSALLTAVIDQGERDDTVEVLQLDAVGGSPADFAIYRRFGFVEAAGPDRPGLRVLTRAA